ncbi:MAG TPA: EAL domain-containing protein, partial [Steroidobacteraceae bacterium]
ENDGSVTARLVDIQHMGVHITVDDFGTGYSSLRHLARLPVDTLKIDRFFVANMMRSPDDMGLISSIISLAHRLDLQVVAEGVETQEQRRLLHLLNCDQIQSLLFAPPLAAAEMECSLRRDQEQQAVEWSLALERLPAN